MGFGGGMGHQEPPCNGGPAVPSMEMRISSAWQASSSQLQCTLSLKTPRGSVGWGRGDNGGGQDEGRFGGALGALFGGRSPLPLSH